MYLFIYLFIYTIFNKGDALCISHGQFFVMLERRTSSVGILVVEAGFYHVIRKPVDHVRLQRTK